jgi:hypothetical protein
MDQSKVRQVLNRKILEDLFPFERSRDFFEAFYGGSEESHFDIRLDFDGVRDNELFFSFQLIQRPGKCLACNMTYGLPHVFARHPIINVNGLVQDIAALLGVDPFDMRWTLGSTSQQSSEIHTIPLVVSVNQSEL